MGTKASPEVLAQLESKLEGAAEKLSKVTGKKMFGCHALWADGNVFALIWKEGRIGLKLTDDAAFGKLIQSPGAVPWKAGPMTMAHWVLVPESFHSKKDSLAQWTKKAHEQALAAPKKKPTARKKAAKKKGLGLKLNPRLVILAVLVLLIICALGGVAVYNLMGGGAPSGGQTLQETPTGGGEAQPTTEPAASTEAPASPTDTPTPTKEPFQLPTPKPTDLPTPTATSVVLPTVVGAQ